MLPLKKQLVQFIKLLWCKTVQKPPAVSTNLTTNWTDRSEGINFQNKIRIFKNMRAYTHLLHPRGHTYTQLSFHGTLKWYFFIISYKNSNKKLFRFNYFKLVLKIYLNIVVVKKRSLTTQPLLSYHFSISS